jgi:adenine-specific DNA-methyltransferase
MQNLMSDLMKLFQKDERIFADRKLLKNKLTELALKLDQPLIELLLSNGKAKEHFFLEKKAEKDKVLIFDKDKFISFVNNKEFLPDSFTSFKNKIGLVSNGEYLKEKGDVILAWAYKDCVLEGGQDKEDQRRDEIFYNETLSPDEIDRLFEPKVLTNFKKYDSKGEHKVTEFSVDDNLIIKGNNLLALHCLKQKFIGQIKLIFIDPPYNTGSDEFGYNDRFNHSSWLTFMKDRLEIAKELLSSDGSIYISVDYNEVHYLKVLMDEIFGRANFQREIIWRIGWLSGYKTVAENYIRNHDTILFYSKDPGNFIFNKIYNTAKDFAERFNEGDKKEIFKYLSKLGIKKDKQKEFYNFLSEVGLPERYPLEDTWNCNSYDKLNSIAIVSYSGEKVSKLLGTKEIKGQKSEKLLKRIVEVSTNKGDLILDFCAGTGTTGAVAHKLGRRWIICEQMDYVKSITVKRTRKVIEGEQIGISKEVNWRGGGSFIYAELMEWNERYMTEIQEADTPRKLLNVYEKMKKEAFFRYDVDLSKFEEKEFEKLSLREQKQVLSECLDKNHLYVNLSEINDTTYKVGDDDKKLNKEFYKTAM